MRPVSKLGKLFGPQAGIVQLMHDLGTAMTVNPDMLMLGGGNPGSIPQMQQVFRLSMRKLLDTGEFDRLTGNYGPPAGDPRFIESLAELLRRSCGWDVAPENIALTNGSQSASFMLFNLLAGEFDDGRRRRILLPLTPEYIGYSDQGAATGFFLSNRPQIQPLNDGLFKYRVDFDSLQIDDSVAALCVSRPTNPTGNVLTDEEITQLRVLANHHGVPLILDNAYGTPFPGICFTEATPVWDSNIIVCMSLSKLGLPGVRTGIVIAAPEIIRALSGMNAILNLTTGGFGPALVRDLIESGEIIRLSQEIIRPFYQGKAQRTVGWLQSTFDPAHLRIHKPEGAIFLWLWFPDLPISSTELYERLKARGVLIIPGEHFFPGLPSPWQHSRECIRLTYAQDDAMVEKAIGILASEVARAYSEGSA